MRSMPPLNALRGFEAAARHLSIKQAAEELRVTPAAVSHQVKALEDWVGAPLFVRMTRALKLTDAGQDALSDLSEGFGKLATAVRKMQAQRGAGLLTISASPSFGAMWLVPRLDRFRARHPDIEIRIDATDRLADIMRGEADVAIRYGLGSYDTVRVDTLFEQMNTPVCNPSLRTQLQAPSDLRRHRLLHVEWMDARASWRMWLLAAGLRDIDATKGPVFTQESMAVQAAIEGQGVALVGNRIISDYLETGALVCPFGSDYRTPLSFAYHLLTAGAGQATPKVEAFRDWILKEIDRSNTLEP